MRLHPAWGFVLFLLALLITGSIAAEDKGQPADYETQQIEGFTVHVSKEAATRQHDGFGRRPLDVLQKELNDLKRILHPRIVGVLQSVTIWADWDAVDKLSPGAVARYYGGEAEALLKLGGDPRKANCVEVLTLKRLAELRAPGTPLQQVVILHEMAHVVHHRLLGWDNPELKSTFQAAVDRKLYDEVNDRLGRRVPAYARTNSAEYFAEVSCAYLDSCNYFPFNQQQLRGYDPEGYKFVERVWREPERFTVIAAKPLGKATQTFQAPAPKNVSAERDAMMRLDRARGLMQSGKSADARRGLEQIIASYPTTEAAGEARELLDSLK